MGAEMALLQQLKPKVGDIRLINTIVHIMDSSIGMPVFSDLEIDNGVDLSEFIREHIYKVMSSDEVKKCSFKLIMKSIGTY